MNWNQAENLLRNNIAVNLHLTPEKNFKIVREIPPFQCKNYEGVEGFRVQVGTRSNVNIPLNMLRVVFEATRKNNNTYNRAIFEEHFPRELNAKPCNVHSVGKLFEYAGVMEMVNRNDYIIVI